MNYIRHLNNFGVLVYGNDRFRASHISLYLSLFYTWNAHRFSKRFPIYRDEIMKQSRIKSRSTYQKNLRDLEGFHLLKYYPSFSPNKPSQVAMFPLKGPVHLPSPKVGQVNEPLYKHSKPLNKKLNKKDFSDALKVKKNKDYNQPL